MMFVLTIRLQDVLRERLTGSSKSARSGARQIRRRVVLMSLTWAHGSKNPNAKHVWGKNYEHGETKRMRKG